MPTPISPVITSAGLAAAIAANGNGLDLEITHVALGAGSYAPSGAETALVDRREKATVSGGGVPSPDTLSILATFPTYGGAEYDMREIGFYAGDPDSGGTLFAVASITGGDRFAVRNASISYTAQYSIALSGVPSGSVTVVVDSEGGIAAALVGVHEGLANPHPQYVLVSESHEVGDLALKYRATAPARWPECAGQTVSRATYPLLYAHAVAESLIVSEGAWVSDRTKFGQGDGATTFRMPDLRGEFIRAWDHGRGVDSGRGLGTAQGQQVAAHKHATSSGTNSPGPFGATDTGGRAGITQDNDNVWDRTNDGSDYDGTVNPSGLIGAENRPRNVAVMVCMFAGRAP